MPCMGYALPEEGLESPEGEHYRRDDDNAPKHRCDDAGGDLDRDHRHDHEDQSGSDLAHYGRTRLALLNISSRLHGSSVARRGCFPKRSVVDALEVLEPGLRVGRATVQPQASQPVAAHRAVAARIRDLTPVFHQDDLR